LALLAAQGCSGGGSLGGETCLTEQVGSSRPGCEQLPGVVQATGNNPLPSLKGFQWSSQINQSELTNKSPVRVFEERSSLLMPVRAGSSLTIVAKIFLLS
jgi:hypothetical protein